MRYAGVVPPDAPDPRLAVAATAAQLPIPLIGLVPQPSLEDADLLSIEAMGRDGASDALAVAVGYTLWRNPDDRSDPVNLVELDEVTRRSLEVQPPWPRPAWILAGIERMRYHSLWDAVRTSWTRESRTADHVPDALLRHVHYILVNRFRDELGLEPGAGAWESPALPLRSAIRAGIEVVVDGERLPGVRLDTDPWVLGLGALLPSGGILTAVVPRDELPYVRLEFATRVPPAGPES